MTTATEACSLSASEPIGTTSTEALACNSSTLDRILNSSAASVTNRVGDELDTFQEVYRQIDEILANSEGVPLGDGVYATGLTYTTRYQFLTQNNIEYRVKSTTALPYTTTEANASDDNNLAPFTGVSRSELNRRFDRLNPATIAEAVADDRLVNGDVLNIKENTTGNGGGAIFDVVLAAGLNIDDFNFIQCVGVPTLALSRRLLGSTQGEEPSAGIGLNFMQQLNANRRDVFMLIQGDSTGNEATEWVYLTSTFLGDKFPAYTVMYHLWNDTTGDYNTPLTLSVGTGTNTLHVYNGSVAGSTALYFVSGRKENMYAGREFDLIIQNYGHNQASSADLNTVTYRLTESVSQLVADQPDAEIALTLQNIDTSLADFTAIQVQATKTVADLFGLPTIDVRSVFRWQQVNDNISDWMADSVHPNAVGQRVWTRIVTEALTNPHKQSSYKRNALPVKMPCPISNPFFSDWAWDADQPLGWNVSGASTQKELTIKETFSWSIRATGTGATTGNLNRDINDYLLQRNSGSGLTFLARVFIPNTNTTNNAGRLEISTNLGSELMSQYPESVDGWTWRMIYAEPSMLDNATSLRISIFSGSSTDVVYVDRIMLIEGRLPSEPFYSPETLSEYYDPSNVGTRATNAVTVNDDSITLDSTSEAFPAFFINVFGLAPNEQHTMTWTYSGTGAGTIIARANLNDSGTVLATVTPLSTGSISWKPTLSSGSLQVSNSLGTQPFTLSDITIQKG